GLEQLLLEWIRLRHVAALCGISTTSCRTAGATVRSWRWRMGARVVCAVAPIISVGAGTRLTSQMRRSVDPPIVLGHTGLGRSENRRCDVRPAGLPYATRAH